MRYPHRLTITRANSAAGTQDADTGAFVTGGAAVTVYNDRADVQDSGEAVPRGASGMPNVDAEASAFLADEAKLFDIMPNDDAVVTYPNGRTADGNVLFVKELDGTVLLKFR